jgi:hypothetical protein
LLELIIVVNIVSLSVSEALWSCNFALGAWGSCPKYLQFRSHFLRLNLNSQADRERLSIIKLLICRSVITTLRAVVYPALSVVSTRNMMRTRSNALP